MWIDKPKDEEQAAQQPDSLNSPSVGAGAGSGAPQIQGSTTPAVGTSSSMSPTPEAPGQTFGTIQDYFKGNQTQGANLTNQFTDKLDTTKQKAQGTIGEAAAGAESQIAPNTVNLDKGLVDKAVSDPTAVANNTGDYSKFMNQWNAAYKGPESFESTDQYTTAAGAAQAAKDKATQASSTGGRQQILQDEFGVYGQGNKGLDEALIQNSGSFGDIGAKANELNSLQGYLQSKSQDIQGKAQAAKATTEATKAATQNAFTGEQGKLASDLDARTKIARDKATTDATALTAALKTGDVNKIKPLLKTVDMPADVKASILDYLSLSNRFYNATPDLSNTYNFNPNTAVTRENVANTGDYNKAAALQKLTGVDYKGILNPATAGQAGVVPDPRSGVDAPALKQRIQDYFNQQVTEDIKQKNPGASAVELPKVNIPSNLDAQTTRLLTQTFNKPVSGAGTYGEGRVIDLNDRLGVLSTLRDSKKITPEQYTSYAQPLAKSLSQIYNSIAGGGQKSGQAINNNFDIGKFTNKYGELLK